MKLKIPPELIQEVRRKKREKKKDTWGTESFLHASDLWAGYQISDNFQRLWCGGQPSASGLSTKFSSYLGCFFFTRSTLWVKTRCPWLVSISREKSSKTINNLKDLHHWKVKDKITSPVFQNLLGISDLSLRGTYSKHYELSFLIFPNLDNKIPDLTERSRHFCYSEFPGQA